MNNLDSATDDVYFARMRNRLIVTLSLLVFGAPFLACARPSDVSSDTWYTPTIDAFVRAGHINDDTLFRPTHNATRGEFVAMIVKVLGGPLHAPFSQQSFDDVPMTSTLYPSFEEAGLTGWLKGTGNCYGSQPCTANPNLPINRAEAAAMIIRAFGLSSAGDTPSFTDNPTSAWYHDIISTAASLCVLKGDAGASRVRPADNMIRAEMVVMLSRAREGLRYPDCSQRSSSSPTSVQCNADDWTCSEWGKCSNGVQSRSCTQTNAACMGKAVAPPLTQTCTESSDDIEAAYHKEIQDNLATWKPFHEKLLARAKEYLQMDAARPGLVQLNRIEAEFVVLYNNYVNAYNKYKTGWLGDNMAEFREIAPKVQALIKEFDAMPLIYY